MIIDPSRESLIHIISHLLTCPYLPLLPCCHLYVLHTTYNMLQHATTWHDIPSLLDVHILAALQNAHLWKYGQTWIGMEWIGLHWLYALLYTVEVDSFIRIEIEWRWILDVWALARVESRDDERVILRAWKVTWAEERDCLSRAEQCILEVRSNDQRVDPTQWATIL